MQRQVAPMKRPTRTRQDPTKEMTQLAQRACLIAKDSAFNVRDYIENSSNIAYVAVKQCEKELDDIEREIDEGLPAAITEVTEAQARQLLACLKFIIDLERIGDLLWSGAQRIQDLSSALPKEDMRVLLEMTGILLRMLEHIYNGFMALEVEPAEAVLQTDSDIDQACHAIFRRHLQNVARRRNTDSFKILLIAQAFERAGDHAKNLAEEVVHLVRGHSFRHSSRARLRSE
jgi:phosphate transport system protein